MPDGLRFYINGDWADPIESRAVDVINPATEKAIGRATSRAAEVMACCTEVSERPLDPDRCR